MIKVCIKILDFISKFTLYLRIQNINNKFTVSTQITDYNYFSTNGWIL